MRVPVKYMLFVFLLPVFQALRAQPFRPDFHLKPDRYSNLLVFDAERSEGITPLYDSLPFRHLKYWAENWNKKTQWVSWNVYAEKDDHYLVNLIANPEKSDVLCSVESNGQAIHTRLVRSDTSEFTRTEFTGQLLLHHGYNKIILRIKAYGPDSNFNVSVHGLELIRPEIKQAYDKRIAQIRKDTKGEWFKKCRYGIFVTWTSQVFPRHGERKDYETAVREFDVDGFVKQITRTGAGLVVFNTSHAEMYFPAPIRSLDSILPGRTAGRDLIAELAERLNEKGIQLFLYYHLGAVSDSVWTKTSGFWNTEETPFFKNWNAVISEIGKRYGKRVSGYWFDDGSMNGYYRSPDWQTMYASAKAGNSDRFVGYNPWKLPPPTLFMDYYLGETNLDPSMHGQLKKDGNGIIQNGPFEGLYASSTFVTESEDWGHFKKETDIDDHPFRYAPDTLAAMINHFEEYGNVPLFNLEIYQPGQMSENSIHRFELAKERMHTYPSQ